jgi:glyoxylase-like metal-dependent hydrolase (beta-lactamase superfamily II)
MDKPNIVNVGCDSTNYYVIQTPAARLLVDVGWPGTLPRLLHTLKRTGFTLSELTHLLVTHYHPDHAGLAQELKHKGLQLIVLENQAAGIQTLKQYIKPKYGYVEITLHDNLNVRSSESRPFLRRLGLQGEILPTPGHSDDSVTLILDTGEAFTGDLPPAALAGQLSPVVQQSWEKIRARGVRVAYPGNGPLQRLV